MHTASHFGELDAAGTERHQERLRRAEAQRLVRQAHKECSETDSLHSLALVRLGIWLEEWGCNLQKRHGDTTPASAL